MAGGEGNAQNTGGDDRGERGRDDDRAWETVSSMARRVDTPQERARLAGALIELREDGLVGGLEAAVAICDLGNGGRYFLTTSTMHALATHFGGDPTPAGLLVAA